MRARLGQASEILKGRFSISLFDFNTEPIDQNFKRLRDDIYFQNEHRFVEKLWEKYKPYSDQNFTSALAAHFHPRFWEMYLTCVLLEQGFVIVPKKQPNGPDIHIRYKEKSIWIEAVAPERGQKNDAVPQRKIGMPSKVPEDQIILRYTSVIKEKFEKYQKYRNEEIISDEEAYIIAVNGGNIPYTFLEDYIPRFIKAVLPIGPYAITINDDTGTAVDEGYVYRPNILKKSGSEVSTTTFLDEEYSEISGLLFSNINVFNRPRDLGRDIMFLHNPNASPKNRVSHGWLKIGREYWLEDDKLRSKDW